MKKKLFLIIAIFIIASSACSNFGTQAEPQIIVVTATNANTVEPTFTPVSVTETFTPTDTEVPTNTEFPTSTPKASPKITAKQDLNCRAGPGTEFSILKHLPTGSFAFISGKSTPDWGEWYLVRIYDTECWVEGYYATISGDTTDIPLIELAIPTKKP